MTTNPDAANPDQRIERAETRTVQANDQTRPAELLAGERVGEVQYHRCSGATFILELPGDLPDANPSGAEWNFLG